MREGRKSMGLYAFDKLAVECLECAVVAGGGGRRLFLRSNNTCFVITNGPINSPIWRIFLFI